MSCSNCYNGCPEIISDQCVRYTGVDVPVLGIKTGDSLSYVEQALVTFLTSTLDGTGIKLDIDPAIICAKVQQYLVTCEDITAKNLFETLIKVVCDLQSQITSLQSSVTSIQTTLNILNADYDVDCLSGVTNSSDTHAVLQATIDKLCQFIIDVAATYVKISDINSYIATYLSTTPIPEPDKWYNRMIPYTIVEFYGSIAPNAIYPGSGFAVGVGYGRFDKLYLCNGANGTPDKRGRVTVGANQTFVGGGPESPIVAPGGFNPNYDRGTLSGNNSVTLTLAQVPTHNHTATSTVSEPNGGLGHRHDFVATNNLDGGPRPNGFSNANTGSVSTYQTDYAVTGITVNTTVANSGGGQAHQNNQPAIGAYFIMYIP